MGGAIYGSNRTNPDTHFRLERRRAQPKGESPAAPRTTGTTPGRPPGPGYGPSGVAAAGAATPGPAAFQARNSTSCRRPFSSPSTRVPVVHPVVP